MDCHYTERLFFKNVNRSPEDDSRTKGEMSFTANVPQTTENVPTQYWYIELRVVAEF
jgi:hypothetical protein